MSNPAKTTQIKHARTIGSFFLLAFLAYGIGRTLFENPNHVQQYLGAGLIALNSFFVIAIGTLMRRTLKPLNSKAASVYFNTRIFEGIALSSIILNLSPNFNSNLDIGYFWAMIVLGVGSIPMCISLLNHSLAPKWQAFWGALAYALMTVGIFLQIKGNPLGMYFLAPGAIWEIVFAIWLLVKNGEYSAVFE